MRKRIQAPAVPEMRYSLPQRISRLFRGVTLPADSHATLLKTVLDGMGHDDDNMGTVARSVGQAMGLFDSAAKSYPALAEQIEALSEVYLLAIEDLPLADSEFAQKRIRAFHLSCDTWWPLHAIEDDTYSAEVAKRGFFAATCYADESQDQCPVRWGEWANATADDTPCFPFRNFREFFAPMEAAVANA